MSGKLNINVHHVTRIEGHANIVVNATNGRIEKIQWQIPEAPRFFEAMVRGRNYEDIQTIVSRICGICSITHSLAATKAVEKALGLVVSEQVDKVRILMHYAEQLQSHILNIGYLVVPDFFGVPSVIPLVAKAGDVVKTIIRLHRLANEWSELIGGRTTHPITLRPGGLTKIPTEQQFRQLQQQLKNSMADLKIVLNAVLSVADNIPDFERETEYVSLRQEAPPSYTFYHGDITSTDYDGVVPVDDWKTVANEYVTEQSTAKWTKWHRDCYAVGALARFNNNADFLSPAAKDFAKSFGLKKGCHNPFMNTIAQLVECAHVVETAIELIDGLLVDGLKQEKVIKIKPKAGKATGCVEAPRGILFHEYEFDSTGNCVAADMCIPTNQNHANIQKDFEGFVPQIISQGENAVRQKLEMLARAYAPCVSCSTHMLNIRFVK
jgi:sulfhydrogenase subunit alpha